MERGVYFEPVSYTISTMARLEDREKAIALRLKGYSYSQIKEAIGVSKSTLHYWLVDYPLSEERIRALRDNSARRIEKYRETVRLRKLGNRKVIREQALLDIGPVLEREFLIAGFFLYWAEGMKVDRGTVLLTNTDPAMLKVFIRWIGVLGVPKGKLKARLHLYSDMNIQKQMQFWSKELGLPVTIFRNTYVKKTDSIKRRNYKGRFGFGTCSLWVHDRKLYDKVMASIDVLKSEVLK